MPGGSFGIFFFGQENSDTQTAVGTEIGLSRENLDDPWRTVYQAEIELAAPNGGNTEMEGIVVADADVLVG